MIAMPEAGRAWEDSGNMSIQDIIIASFQEVMQEHTGETCPAINQDDALLETGLDSLGFAILVTRLEEELGFDPFVEADDPYYPETFGEFVKFYESHATSRA